MEQYSRKNSLEFCGVPDDINMSTDQAVCKIAQAIGVEIKEDDIEISHRIKTKHGNKPILAKFCNHKIKSKVYKARTQLRSTTISSIFPDCVSFTTEDNRQPKIFINENLTQYRKEMMKTAREKRNNGGDWNVSLQAIDKQGGIHWRPTAYRHQIIAMMEELDLSDVFRKMHPNKKSLTYASAARNLKSRIDFFLVAKSIACQVAEVGTKTSIAPDHKAVKLRINLANIKRGPGLWKFNNLLLKDDNFVNLITFIYPDIIKKYSDLENPKLKWELIKMEIRRFTNRYDSGECTTDAEQKEHEHLKTELRNIHEKRAEGAIFRSKVRWIQEGEKPTNYFFNMERRNFNKKVISEIAITEGYVTNDEKKIMEEIKSFYENLYGSSKNATNEVFQEFTDSISQHIPMLSQDQCNEIEGVLTLDECWAALKSMGTGKSPGEDGFTVEFYRCFFDLLGNDLLNSLNAAYENGEMSISQRRGVITVIPKENSDPRELSNWRPITLLNVDYKIASKAIATRIEKFLPLLINSNQTGFMKGRYIGQNIRLINDIMEQTELQGIPGILLLLDFRKAFDTIEWGFIQQTLKPFNFGSCLRHWVKTLYTNFKHGKNKGSMVRPLEI
ncbi:hypothetical protein ACROYT_G006002 [Oculina patagonica]